MIEAALQTILKGLRRPDARLIRVEHANVNHVFLCDADLVLRLTDTADGHHRLDTETALLQALERRTRLTPRILEHGRIDQVTYQVENRIAGQTLTSTWSRLPEKDKIGIIDALCQWLVHLHEIEGEKFGMLHRECQMRSTWIGHILNSIEASIGLFDEGESPDWISYLREETYSAIEKYRDRSLDEFGNSLLHFDLWPNNIIIHKGRLAGIVDFEMAAYGPPHADLYKMEFFCRRPEDFGIAGDFQQIFRLIQERYPSLVFDQDIDDLYYLYDLNLIWQMLAHSARLGRAEEMRDFSVRHVRDVATRSFSRLL